MDDYHYSPTLILGLKTAAAATDRREARRGRQYNGMAVDDRGDEIRSTGQSLQNVSGIVRDSSALVRQIAAAVSPRSAGIG